MIITIPWLKEHLKTNAKETEIIICNEKGWANLTSPFAHFSTFFTWWLHLQMC